MYRVRCDANYIRQANMSSRFSMLARAAVMAAMLAAASPMVAQQTYDVDPEIRIQQLENQLRQLTGQNEELQYRNRQLEERLRQLGAAPAGPAAQPNVAAIPAQPVPAPRQPPVQQAPTDQQIAAPAPIIQEPAPQPSTRRRSDAFDPGQNPNAPGAPRALGGGQLPIPGEVGVGAPGGRGPGEPLDLGNTAGVPRDPAGTQPPRGPGATAALTTLPPSATPRDEFDLGIGYMQRKDYALAEETMRNFAQKYPADPLLADSQYWLGESFFQRQKYRDAAESFLGVTTKFGTSAKAPDALLRLGQSLAALNEKEAACAALGEVTRKYPRASNGVKQAVDREQKRVKC
jgi:tol-pal system protein YbgF